MFPILGTFDTIRIVATITLELEIFYVLLFREAYDDLFYKIYLYHYQNLYVNKPVYILS